MNEQTTIYELGENQDLNASYEWNYTVSFSQIWHIPIIIWKTMGIVMVILWIVFFLLLRFFGNFEWKFVWGFTSYLVFFGACFAVLIGIIFLFIGIFTRGHMNYHLRITPEAIFLVKNEKEKKRNDMIATASVVTGILTGNAGTTFTGTAMLSGDLDRVSYSGIKRVRLYRSWNLINLTRVFSMFPVYVRPEDYDFVKRYIIAHLPEKKRIRYEVKMQ